MEVILCKTQEEANLRAARIFQRQLRAKPASVLGLATGGTPCGLYRLFVEMHKRGEMDFSMVRSFNLDEYVGLPESHPASYRFFMREQLFSKVNIRPENTRVPDGMTTDIPSHCNSYEEEIRAAGGIDIQLLGIGSDGHIGFNEPGSSLASRTRIKTLTERTRADNASFFAAGETVPHHVITMGLGTIMEASMCVLLAYGEGKADAVAKMVEGPVSANVPASILQFHPCAKIFLDEAAGSRLARADYYRWVYQNKPDWQQDR